VPTGPWIMAQTWHDLLFAHWPMTVDALRGQVPAGIEIDTYDGEAWVGVIPFWMSGVRPRWTPSLPRISTFPELNVRTYVKLADKPGVFFFSLDAGNPLAVAVARWRYHVPCCDAAMATGWVDRWVRYASRRVHAHAPPAEFRGRYRPTGDVSRSELGSLAAWLTERYASTRSMGAGRSTGPRST